MSFLTFAEGSAAHLHYETSAGGKTWGHLLRVCSHSNDPALLLRLRSVRRRHLYL